MIKIKLDKNKGWSRVNGKGYYDCPNCKSSLIKSWNKYCGNCGAEILWEHIIKSYEVKK